MELCLQIADRHGLSLRSMVFPGGTRGHFDILEDLGFTSYRGRPQPKVELNYPIRTDNNLWEIPTATIVGGMIAQNYQHQTASWLLNRYLAVASSKNLVSHFWFHPSCDEVTTEILFPKLIREIAKRRDIGETAVMTMDSLADYCETRNNASIKVAKNGFSISSSVSKPYIHSSISVCLDNPNIESVVSANGNIYPVLTNNGVRFVEIPPSEYGVLLRFSHS